MNVFAHLFTQPRSSPFWNFPVSLRAESDSLNSIVFFTVISFVSSFSTQLFNTFSVQHKRDKLFREPEVSVNKEEETLKLTSALTEGGGGQTE